MAIQTLSFISLILRPWVEQDIDKNCWKYLLSYSDRHRNFDGEIMAFGAMSGGPLEETRDYLVRSGYIGPDNGDKSDMIISDMFMGESDLPSWLVLVDVTFFDESRSPVKAWKKKDSEVYKLVDFESEISVSTKGYECDWSPHIGKIS